MTQEIIDTAASQTSAEGSSQTDGDSSQNATVDETPAIDWEARAKKAETELTRKTDSDSKAEQGRTKSRNRTDEALRGIEARLASAAQDSLLIAQSLETGEHEGLVSKLTEAKAASTYSTVESESTIIMAEIETFLGTDSPINRNTEEVMNAAGEFNAAKSLGDIAGMRRAKDMVETAHKNATDVKSHADELADRDKTITDLKAQQRQETDADNLDTGGTPSGAGLASMDTLLAMDVDAIPFSELGAHQAKIEAAMKRESG